MKLDMSKLVLVFCLMTAGLQAQVAVVNSASFAPGQPVTTGSWAAAFGSFSGVITTAAATMPLPNTLAGVKVTIEGVDAPLSDVRQSQITFLVPGSITAGVHPIVVTTPAGNTTGTIRVISSAPGLFVKDSANPPRAAAVNADGTENSSSSPARRGDAISLYGTGPGAFLQPFVDGAAPGRSPLVNTKSTPQVFIDGIEAKVSFSGLSPEFPGVWQINVTIPSDGFVAGKVPVRVFMDGVDSNEVGIFVQ